MGRPTTILVILALVATSCATSHLTAPSSPDDFNVTVEWGHHILAIRQRLRVQGGSAEYSHFLFDEYVRDPLFNEELQEKYAKELADRSTVAVHPIHIDAFKKNLDDTDFFSLDSSYSNVPAVKYSGVVRDDGSGVLRVGGFTADGWVVRVVATVGTRSNDVTVSNGCLNSFIVILKSMARTHPKLAEYLTEPLAWMRQRMLEAMGN